MSFLLSGMFCTRGVCAAVLCLSIKAYRRAEKKNTYNFMQIGNEASTAVEAVPLAILYLT